MEARRQAPLMGSVQVEYYATNDVCTSSGPAQSSKGLIASGALVVVALLYAIASVATPVSNNLWSVPTPMTQVETPAWMQQLASQHQQVVDGATGMRKSVGGVAAAAMVAAASVQAPGAMAMEGSSSLVIPPAQQMSSTSSSGVQATLGVKIQDAPSLTAPVPAAPAAPVDQTDDGFGNFGAVGGDWAAFAERAEEVCATASFATLFATLLVYWVQSAYYPESETLKKIGYVGMAASNVMIAGLLSFRWSYIGHFPLSNLYESLMFLAWGLTTVPLALERQVAYGVSTGAIFAPLVLLVNAFAQLILPPELQKASALVPALKSNWLMMHVSVMMLSYSILLAGSVMAMAYLFVTRNEGDAPKQLSEGSADPEAAQPTTVLAAVSSEAEAAGEGEATDLIMTLDGSAIQGPNVERNLADTLDNLSYRTLILGFPLLTIGIISGAVWANEAWGSYWSWDPKETWALITWLVYSFYLHTRLNKGWQGKTSALVASSGFVVVWVCYIGVNLFGVGLHSYGFFSK